MNDRPDWVREPTPISTAPKHIIIPPSESRMESMEAYRDYFNKVAAIPENRRTYAQRYYIVAHFKPRPNSVILDIGAYLGNNIRTYVREGHTVDGVEIGQAYVDTWNLRKDVLSKEELSRARMFCAAFEEWEADRTYDYILCCEMLEHVMDPEMFVVKAAGLLNPEGRLFLTSPREKTRTAMRVVSAQDLRGWTASAGMDVETMIVSIPSGKSDEPVIWTPGKKYFGEVPQWICIAKKRG